MKIGIVGGKLQGLEVCYLAKKAGWDIVLIDKNQRCISAGLADRFCCLDMLTEGKDKLLPILSQCDLILPAVEDDAVLKRLCKLCRECGVPLVYDEEAYRLSSSKVLSNRLFQKLGLNIPAVYPAGKFPYIVKPSGSSGSAGVRLAGDEAELKKLIARYRGETVIQEYIPGPSYSIEVIGDGAGCTPYLVTGIVTDDDYDCCGVTAENDFFPEINGRMCEIGEMIGGALKIKGIFDVETILGPDGNMYVLEIDARFPSQTPITVFHACGINLLEMLWVQRKIDRKLPGRNIRNVIYRNVHARKTADAVGVTAAVISPGEHAIARAGWMKIIPGFFGADEAITDYCEGANEFFAILIFSGNGPMPSLSDRWAASLEKIRGGRW